MRCGQAALQRLVGRFRTQYVLGIRTSAMAGARLASD